MDQRAPVAGFFIRQKRFFYGDKPLSERSPGLLAFVAYLYWKRCYRPHTPWVDRAELSRVLPRATDKQLQRYVDSLFAHDFDLIEYRTKTRGPWRFVLAPELVSIDVDEAGLLAWLGFRPGIAPEAAATVAEQESAAGQTQTALDAPAAVLTPGTRLADALLKTYVYEAAFRNRGLDQRGELPEAVATYLHLGTDPVLPPLVRAGILQRLCMLCRQAHNFVSWRQAIGELEALLQSGLLQGSDFAPRSLLLQGFWHYDQGQYVTAAALLERINPHEIRDTLTLGRYHNMSALMLMRQIRAGLAAPATAPSLAQLAQWTLQARQALEQGIVQAGMVDDYWGLEGMCFNYGNLLWITRSLATPETQPVKAAARWVGLCEQICLGFGVGGNAAWSRLLLIDMALDQDWNLDELNQHAGLQISADVDLETMLLSTQEDAHRRGSLPEEQEAATLLSRLYLGQGRHILAAFWRSEAEAMARQRRVSRQK